MSSSRKGWFRELFARPVDFLVFLAQQADYAREAVDALRCWSADNDTSAIERIVDIEKASDELRATLVTSAAKM